MGGISQNLFLVTGGTRAGAGADVGARDGANWDPRLSFD